MLVALDTQSRTRQNRRNRSFEEESQGTNLTSPLPLSVYYDVGTIFAVLIT